MFEIFADWPKNAKFCTRKQKFYWLVAFSTLELNDWSSHSHVKIAKFNTCKIKIIPKLRENVPVNNSHLKYMYVGFSMVQMWWIVTHEKMLHTRECFAVTLHEVSNTAQCLYTSVHVHVHVVDGIIVIILHPMRILSHTCICTCTLLLYM